MDVHKKSVVVVVLQSDQPGADQATGIFGTTRLGVNEWITSLRHHGVREVALEWTAQYGRPVWMALEGQFALTLAQARSTRAPGGRKWDQAAARRIAKRLLSGDLTISYVPSPLTDIRRLGARRPRPCGVGSAGRLPAKGDVPGQHVFIDSLFDIAA